MKPYFVNCYSTRFGKLSKPPAIQQLRDLYRTKEPAKVQSASSTSVNATKACESMHVCTIWACMIGNCFRYKEKCFLLCYKKKSSETRGKQPHLSMQFYTQVNWCLLDFNCAILQKQLVGREVCNMCTFCLTFSRLGKIMESLHAARFFHVNKQEDLKDSG